jgi:hypothetical protein
MPIGWRLRVELSWDRGSHPGALSTTEPYRIPGPDKRVAGNPGQLEVVGQWPRDDALVNWLDDGLHHLIDSLSTAPNDLRGPGPALTVEDRAGLQQTQRDPQRGRRPR